MTVSTVFGAASLGKVFYEDAIIHRFVTTVDNLPRKTVPQRNLPVKQVAGPLVTTTKDDNVSISADNASRYTPYVQMAEAIDAKNLVSAYVHFYPLIQQDYRDLGYPKGYFNDRLIEAIADLLARRGEGSAPIGPAQGPVPILRPGARGAFCGTEDHDAHGRRECDKDQSQAAGDSTRVDGSERRQSRQPQMSAIDFRRRFQVRWIRIEVDE
jgi:hypothetical protein